MKTLFITITVILLTTVTLSVFPKNKKIELEVVIHYDAGQAYYDHIEEVFKEFEEIHNVTVTHRKLPFLSTDDTHKTYIQLFSSGTSTPDVIQIDEIRIPEFAELGFIADITDYFPKSEQEKFIPVTIEEVTWKNRIWGYPFFSAVGLIGYRKDILDKYGYQPPENWDELIKMAQKLQSDTLTGYVAQMAKYEGLVCNALEFIWSNGGEPKFDMPVNLTTPQIIEGIQMMVDMVNKYKITPEQQLRYKEDEGRQLFLSGKALFARQWTGKWLSPNYDKYKRNISEINVLKMPVGPSGKKGIATRGGWALAVNSKSKNRDLAIKLAAFLTNRKNQKRELLKWGYFPTRTALYEDKDLLEAYPWFGDFYPYLLQARLRPRTPYYPEISKIMQEELHLALEGKITPKSAMERCEKKIVAFLQIANRERGN